MQLLTYIYGYLRVLIVVVHNLYHVPAFLFLNWIILLPLKLVKSSLYDRLENFLYTSCLYTVSSWSWCGGIHVYEVGADLSKNIRCSKKKPKLLVVGNHQCTSDVPLFMYSLTSHPEYILMWVMSDEFKYTNFGPVSLTHEDYFLSQIKHVKGDLVKHCLKLRDQRKNCYILFPEGGFRYKRLKKSNEFAAKNNLPPLQRVVWPRYGAFEELFDERLSVTHIVDLTILYKDQNDTLSILDIAKGIREEPVYFLFRVFEVCDDDKSIVNQTGDASQGCHVTKITRKQISLEWLQSLWKEKEQILDLFYTNQEKFFQTYGAGRRVDLNYAKIIFIHFFYISMTAIMSLCLYALSKAIIDLSFH